MQGHTCQHASLVARPRALLLRLCCVIRGRAHPCMSASQWVTPTNRFCALPSSQFFNSSAFQYHWCVCSGCGAGYMQKRPDAYSYKHIGIAGRVWQGMARQGRRAARLCQASALSSYSFSCCTEHQDDVLALLFATVLAHNSACQLTSYASCRGLACCSLLYCTPCRNPHRPTPPHPLPLCVLPAPPVGTTRRCRWTPSPSTTTLSRSAWCCSVSPGEGEHRSLRSTGHEEGGLDGGGQTRPVPTTKGGALRGTGSSSQLQYWSVVQYGSAVL